MWTRFFKFFKKAFSWMYRTDDLVIDQDHISFEYSDISNQFAAQEAEFRATCLEITLAGLHMAQNDPSDNEVLQLYCDNIKVILLPDDVQQALGLAHDHEKLMHYVWKNPTTVQPQLTI
jgi:hypothetical protein